MKGDVGFKFELKDIPVVKELAGLAKKAELVEFRTVRDMRRRIPGTVSAGVCKVYQIKKSEVVSIASSKGRGRNAGKGAVSTSMSGTTIETLQVTFKGKVSANWPTKPKRRPKGTMVIRVGGQRHVVPKTYQVTQETFRGKPTVIKPTDRYRAFVVTGRNRVYIVGDDNNPLIKASTSVPQAIRSKEAMEQWVPKLNKKLETIFYGHFNRIMKK